jgi:hypothetical protein
MSAAEAKPELAIWKKGRRDWNRTSLISATYPIRDLQLLYHGPAVIYLQNFHLPCIIDIDVT